MKAFPDPDCESGYSLYFLEETMPLDAFDDFMIWMNGQTMCICDGRRYSHEDKQYYETGCGPHGAVAYSWDVHRWLGLIPGRDIWD